MVFGIVLTTGFSAGWNIFKLIVITVLVLILAFYATKLIAKYQNNTLSERASFHVEGPKLYRNYIYSISLSSLDSTNTELFIISERNTTSANVTTNTSCLNPNLLPEEYRYIERFTLLKDSNSSERSLPYDLELLKEVLLNSDIFVFKPKDNSEYTKVGDEILLQWGNYGSSLPPPGVIGDHFKDEIMHISECTIDFIRK